MAKVAKVEVRKADRDDIIRLAPVLREADRLEVWAAGRQTPADALALSFDASEDVRVIVREDQVIGMFGIAPQSLMDEGATVWLLGAEEISRVPVSFVKISKKYIKKYLTRYPILENWVDARYVKTLKWLKCLGAEIRPAEPYGPDGMLFCRIIIKG